METYGGDVKLSDKLNLGLNKDYGKEIDFVSGKLMGELTRVRV